MQPKEPELKDSIDQWSSSDCLSSLPRSWGLQFAGFHQEFEFAPAFNITSEAASIGAELEPGAVICSGQQQGEQVSKRTILKGTFDTGHKLLAQHPHKLCDCILKWRGSKAGHHTAAPCPIHGTPWPVQNKEDWTTALSQVKRQLPPSLLQCQAGGSSPQMQCGCVRCSGRSTWHPAPESGNCTRQRKMAGPLGG